MCMGTRETGKRWGKEGGVDSGRVKSKVHRIPKGQ